MQQSAQFNVREFGATGDGIALDTASIQKAIDACSSAAGGRVILPSGVYLSGTLHLRDHVTLVLEARAILRGTPDLAEYRFAIRHQTTPQQRGAWHRALLLVENATDVHITGHGIIDGNSVRNPQGEEGMRGPHTVHWDNARACSISGVDIINSGNYAMLAIGSEDLKLDNVRVAGGWDGIHARKCKQLTVEHCTFSTGDDCIAGGDLENAIFRDCQLNTACNAVRIIGPCNHLSVTDCQITGPGRHPHITMKRHNTLAAIIYQPGAWGQAPGSSDDITFARLQIRDVQTAIHVGMRPGCAMGRIVFEDIKATGIYGPASSVEGCDDGPIQQTVLRRVHIEHILRQEAPPQADKDEREQYVQTKQVPKPLTFCVRALPCWGLYVRNVSQLVLEDVQIQRPLCTDGRDFLCEHISNIQASGFVTKIMN